MTARDPFPYDGPIARADGARPFNRYLWPSEQWVFYREHPRSHVDFEMRIEIVALADGRFATCGFVHSIEREVDLNGRRCVFTCRRAAVRASAARTIRLCRLMVRNDWKRPGITAQTMPEIISWARTVAARETGGAAPRPISVYVPPPQPAPRARTGLPLFDFEGAA